MADLFRGWGSEQRKWKVKVLRNKTKKRVRFVHFEKKKKMVKKKFQKNAINRPGEKTNLVTRDQAQA